MFYNYIQEKGWELYRVYQDVKSGTTEKRTEFKRLVADAEEKKFDVILTKELSRLARNGELAYKLRRVFKTHKIDLVSLDGAVNTLEDNADKFGLYAWLYEEESQRTSKRIRANLTQKARRGEFKGSNAPYGYKVEGKCLAKRDDETVEAVRLIFRLYLEGKGVEAIAKELDRLGYPTPAQVASKSRSGPFWQGSSVKKILENPHYTGDMVQGRTTVRSITDKVRDTVPVDQWITVAGTHEPIIPRQDYEAVKAVMAQRSYKRPKMKKHLFTNYVFCADCGTSLWYLQSRKGYVCGRFKKHGAHTCTSHAIKEQFLKNLILEDLREMAHTIDKGSVLSRVQGQVKKAEQDRKKRLFRLEKELTGLKDENRQYLKLLAQGVITQEDYRETVDVNRDRMAALEQELVEARRTIEQGEKAQDTLQKLAKELERVLEFDDLTEELLHRLVERIEVGEGQQVVIQYRFANPFSLVG